MLEFYEPNTGKYGNCLKTWHIDLDKTYRNAANTPSLPRVKDGQKGKVKLTTTKRRGHHNSIKPITVGP
jgi:hypothetical protein